MRGGRAGAQVPLIRARNLRAIANRRSPIANGKSQIPDPNRSAGTPTFKGGANYQAVGNRRSRAHVWWANSVPGHQRASRALRLESVQPEGGSPVANGDFGAAQALGQFLIR